MAGAGRQPGRDAARVVRRRDLHAVEAAEVDPRQSAQALAYLRALTGIDFRGFDCVEVSPPYDPSGITAWLAASACHEMISLAALRADVE